MEHLENECNKQINFHILFFYRYVDDIILCTSHTNIFQLLNIYNNFHPRLQFTIEQESPHREISFLNLQLIVKDSHIKTNWFRKQTWSGRVLNYYSHHTHNQKIAMIYNLVDSALDLSDSTFHTSNLNLVTKVLQNNHYPDNFINKHMTNRIKSKEIPIQKTQEKTKTEDNFKTVTMPSHNNINVQIKQHLNKYNLKPIFYNKHKTTHLFNKHKETTKILDSSNLIYKIPCSDCNKVYIGETKQYLHKRIYQHKYDIKKDPSLYTSLTKHRVESNHNIDFDKTSIISLQKNPQKRLILEMIHISNNNTMNTKNDVQKLSSIYKLLLDKG